MKLKLDLNYFLLLSVLVCYQLTSVAAGKSEKDIFSGEVNYRNNCARCHGADGSGTKLLRQIMGLNTIDLSAIDTAIEVSQIDLEKLLKKGRVKQGMPAFGEILSDTQRASIIKHLSNRILPQDKEFASLRKGQLIYRRHCSVCHGDRGEVAIWAKAGLDPRPADFSDELKKKQLKRQRMLFSVANGRPETAMTSWYGRFIKLEIENTVDYIRVALMKVGRYDKELGFNEGVGAPQSDPFLSAKDFNVKDVAKVADLNIKTEIKNKNDPFLNNPEYSTSSISQTKNDDIYDPLNASHDHNAHFGGNLNIPLPASLFGRREQGRELFDNNCAACHGRKGNGKGPRSYFIFPKPRNFHHPAVVNKFTRSHIFNQISKGINGTVMPGWENVLNKQQIADITEYLFVDIIHKGKIFDSNQSQTNSSQEGKQLKVH